MPRAERLVEDTPTDGEDLHIGVIVISETIIYRDLGSWMSLEHKIG